MVDETTTETTETTTEVTTDEPTTEVVETKTETTTDDGKPEGSETTTEETTTTETESKVETKTESETTAESTDEPIDRVVPEAGDYVLPEGVPLHMAEFANEHGFTQEQFDATLKQFGGFLKVSKDANQKLLKDSGDAKTESWGEEKAYNLSLVRRALKQNDPEGTLTKMLNTSGYGNHPAVLDFFLKIGKSMKEGGFISGAIHRPQGKKTAATAMFGKEHPSAN